MSNPYRTERRTLGVRADYQGRSARPAWTFAEGSQDREQRQQTHGEARASTQRQHGRQDRREPGLKPKREWFMPFQTIALLRVGEPQFPSRPDLRKCQHLRSNGELICELVAKFHPLAAPNVGARVEVGGTLELSPNGRFAPLARLTVHRWVPK